MHAHLTSLPTLKSTLFPTSALAPLDAGGDPTPRPNPPPPLPPNLDPDKPPPGPPPPQPLPDFDR